jgi:hypothetical protein
MVRDQLEAQVRTARKGDRVIIKSGYGTSWLVHRVVRDEEHEGMIGKTACQLSVRTAPLHSQGINIPLDEITEEPSNCLWCSINKPFL